MENTVICTINELFTWYMGPEWYEDWQTTNVMSHLIDNKLIHCQDDGEDGMSHLRFLKENENEIIKVETNYCEDSYYDLGFIIKDIFYSVQSIYPALFKI